MSFITTLRGEFIKVKRTSLIYFTLLAAAFTPAVMLMDNVDGTPDTDFGKVDPYRSFYLEAFPFIGFMILPLFIVLITTLLMQIEYRNNAWKQVLSTPQQLYSILLSKFMVVQGLTIVMLVTFNLFMVGVAAIIDLNYPEFKIMNFIESWPRLCNLNARTYIASLGLSGLQFWFALRFRNFIAPLGIGLALWVISPLLLLELKWEGVMEKFPYAMSIVVGLKRFESIHVWTQWLSVIYMMVFMAVAYLDFGRRKLKV